ncbi:MAG TPA: NAD(P)H-dependent glycerol-3-phosphate dehydrogenase [Longimicrobiales bacterium]
MTDRVAVLGAGSWGTTLANLLAKKGYPVTLWAYEPEVAAAISTSHENPAYLPGIALDPRLRATADLAASVAGADVVVSVSPSQHVRRVLGAAAPHLAGGVLLVSASKGIETSSLKTMAEVIRDVAPHLAGGACHLSGPSFALEVAQEQPTAVTVASEDAAAALRAQEMFQTEYFRVYTTGDVRGVELGGALKNVIALAAGMVAGLGFGHNTMAALITRGLAEISRLGVSLGASPLTFAGLAGMGDLILTCTGGLSRNRRVGMLLGQGRKLDEILAEMTMVAEGVETARAAYALAARVGVEMPILAEVHAVLFEGRHPREAVDNLMMREPKAELWQ